MKPTSAFPDDRDALFDGRKYEAQLTLDASELNIAGATSALDQAREFGGWTLDKLDLFDLYLKQYRRVAGNGSYIDGFAGTGQVRVGGELSRGSASRALKSHAFKRLYLYELSDQADALRKHIDYYFGWRTARRCTVRPGDFNETVLADLHAGLIPKDKPCFAFLDPDSTQLAWDTVAELAEYKAGGDPPRHCRIELWILFNTHQAIQRLMPRQGASDYPRSASAATLDRIMGGRDAWWDLYRDGRAPSLLASRYAERLEGLGYAAARPHLIKDPATGRPQYHMIHASDHPAAFRFMLWAQGQGTRGQRQDDTLPGF